MTISKLTVLVSFVEIVYGNEGPPPPGGGEVGPRQRAGSGWQRFRIDRIAVISGAARTPLRTAFGSPTLPLQGRVAKRDCAAHKNGGAKEGKP